MSTRFEGAGAKDTRITIVEAGEQIGDDVVPEGQIALCFNYDEVFYIQGTVEEVRRLLTTARMKLREVEFSADNKEYERLRQAVSEMGEGE